MLQPIQTSKEPISPDRCFRTVARLPSTSIYFIRSTHEPQRKINFFDLHLSTFVHMATSKVCLTVSHEPKLLCETNLLCEPKLLCETFLGDKKMTHI